MYNSDHTAPECIGQKNFFLLLPPQSVDVLSRFIYTALWGVLSLSLSLSGRQRGCVRACFMEKDRGRNREGEREKENGRERNREEEGETATGREGEM